MNRTLFIPLITAVLFGLVFVAGKFLATSISPITLSFLRFGFTTIIFIPVVIYYRKELKTLTCVNWLMIIIAALLGIVIYTIFFYWALDFTTATNVALIHAVNPLITLLLAYLILKEKVTQRVVLGFIAAIIGIMIVVSHGSLTTLVDLRFNTGELLMLVATIVWAGYTIILKKIKLKALPPLALTGLIAILGWIMLLPLALYEGQLPILHTVTWSAWLAIVYMGIGSSGVGYYLYTTSTRTLGPALTSLIVYSTAPIVVAVTAWLWLGELISVFQVIGFICIGVGLVTALKTKLV